MTLPPVILRQALQTLAATLLLAPCESAQQIDDPANLAGERVSPQALGDTLPINHGAPALQQLLLKLRTRASMMMIVAHPDDEDGGLLTYESRGQGARVAMLTLTRGEGGQNLVSADFNDALGLIRTQELLAADRYMGVDQMFGTEVDFGFSKTKEESFQKWTYDRVLYDAVRCVRLYRPLVLASVFVGGVTDGHGHHQVAGEITQEVFTAAADPRIFPEMIKQGLLPWAPLKVYARVPFFRVTSEGMFDYATGKYSPVRFHNYVTGQDITHEPAATVEVHEGEASPQLGMEGLSYVQFARKGLALQKTQIGANVRLAPAGAYDVGYTLMASRAGVAPGARPTASNGNQEQSLFDGIDITLPGIATLAPAAPQLREALSAIDVKLAEAQRVFDPAHLELTALPLSEALHKLDALLAMTETSSLDPAQKFNLSHELRIKRVQLNDALVLALGLSTRSEIAASKAPLIIPIAQSPRIVETIPVHFEHMGDGKIDLVTLTSPGTPAPPSSTPARSFERTQDVDLKLNVNFPAGLSHATRPYFSRPNIEQPFYEISRPALRNAPSTPPFLSPGGWFRYKSVLISVESVAQSAGQPLVTVPALSISIPQATGILRGAEKSFTLKALLQSESAAPIAGSLCIEHPAGWAVSPDHVAFSINRASGVQDLAFTVTPRDAKPDSHYTLAAVASSNGQQFREAYRPLGYSGLTSTNYYTPATYRATAVDVTTAPNLRIAYLPGTGDAVPSFLPSLGVTPAIIALADLTPDKLKQYDVVLLGVRAYAAHPELAGKGSKSLLEYARSGGVVIVQYNNSVYDADSAPYPISVPGDPGHNVVVEADAVTLLKPEAPLLNWPNKITAADFKNWVEERGHGFAASFDPRYEALLETHDPDQDPQRGGLLVAHVGQGTYIYCALALYRQLPEGVPGAYRVLANLLSYARNPGRP